MAPLRAIKMFLHLRKQINITEKKERIRKEGRAGRLGRKDGESEPGFFWKQSLRQRVMCEWVILEVWAWGAEVRGGGVKQKRKPVCFPTASCPPTYLLCFNGCHWWLEIDLTEKPFGMWKEGRREERKDENQKEGEKEKIEVLGILIFESEGLTETPLKYLRFSDIRLLYIYHPH